MQSVTFPCEKQDNINTSRTEDSQRKFSSLQRTKLLPAIPKAGLSQQSRHQIGLSAAWALYGSSGSGSTLLKIFTISGFRLLHFDVQGCVPNPAELVYANSSIVC